MEHGVHYMKICNTITSVKKPMLSDPQTCLLTLYQSGQNWCKHKSSMHLKFSFTNCLWFHAADWDGYSASMFYHVSSYYVLGRGLSHGHGECGSGSLYRESGVERPPAGSRRQSPGGIREQSLPESESSVAFEALAEEPNLTLVTDSFLQLI